MEKSNITFTAARNQIKIFISPVLIEKLENIKNTLDETRIMLEREAQEKNKTNSQTVVDAKTWMMVGSSVGRLNQIIIELKEDKE
jgi:hypothetical protein